MSLVNNFLVAQKEIEINYLVPLAIVKCFSKQLKSFDNSTIVDLNSIVSLVNFPTRGTYLASKVATHSLTRAQCGDFPGTLVVGVYPSPTDTYILAKTLPSEKTSTATVASDIGKALRNKAEDIFPNPVAVQMQDGWKADAKVVMELQMQQMANLAPATAQQMRKFFSE